MSSNAATTVHNNFNDHIHTTPPEALGRNSVPDVTAHTIHRDSQPLPTRRNKETDYSTGAIESGLPGAIGASTDTDRCSIVTSGRSGRFGPTGLGLPPNRDQPSVGRDPDGGAAARMHAPSGLGDHRTEPLSRGSSKPEKDGEAGGKVSVGDKIVGTTKEITGKMIGKAHLAEQGHTRKTEGKAGVEELVNAV